MDGLIDVIYSPGHWCGGDKFILHPLMTEPLQVKDIHFIPLTHEELERGSKISGWPCSTKIVPAGAFAPNVPAQDMLAIINMLGWYAYPEVDDEILYEAVRVAYEHMEAFGEAHVGMTVMSPETIAWLPAASEAEVHPGALKYYQENGIKVSVGGASPGD